MGHSAPITRVALAFAAGTALGMLGAPTWIAPLILFLQVAAPIGASAGPRSSPIVAAVAAIGLVGSSFDADHRCGLRVAGQDAVVSGRFLATPRDGSGPFDSDDGCGAFTVVMSGPVSAAARTTAGQALIVHGVWRDGRRRPWLQATRSEAGSEVSSWVGELRWGMVRWRDRLVARVRELYGPQGDLVSALILARREGLDPVLRDRFAITGIAHLLAISGFHVGVIAGLALAVLRGLRVARRRAELGAAATSTAYVALIGFPDAACRAALILVFAAMSRARGRPPTRWGALSGCGLLLLFVEPAKLVSPGFQLSFAGAAGLVAWSGPLVVWLERLGGRRLPRWLVAGLASGAAATLATLPIAAWHFERISLLGIPMTLAATPLITLALPGALVSLAADVVYPPAASFLAGGVSMLLDALVLMTEEGSRLPGVTVWTSQGSVLAGVAGVLVARLAASRPGVGRRGRWLLVGAYASAAIVAWPVAASLQARGNLELVVIDVGQGDAIAIRTPKGRWLLVDAGPPLRPVRGFGTEPPSTESVPTRNALALTTPPRADLPDSRAHPVVRELRGRGVRRLEMLVLTHPDLDHVGGAEAVLASFDVGMVTDPALAAPKAAYASLLTRARSRDVPWVAARHGQTIEIDGVRFRVLNPPDTLSSGTEANDASVVLLVTWGGFSALLTGDAYVGVERRIMETVGDIDVLKVGHHGSKTSTDSTFLTRVRPEVALISVGRRNRYGHPSSIVVSRLRSAGVAIHRTDRDGTLHLIVRPDGSYQVRSDRGPM